MPAYDSERFDPPAPLVHVAIRDLKLGIQIADVPMLVDSGADVTLVPVEPLSSAGIVADPGLSYELVGFDGHVSLARTARLELTVLERTFRGLYLFFDKEYGILGRDILNLLVVRLDGPKQSWSGH